MSDSIYRSPSTEETQSESLPSGKTSQRISNSDKVEVPYTSYHQEHGKSYIVDHFDLLDLSGESERIFEEEINALDSYIGRKIANGDIADSVSAAKKEIKAIEKLNNVKDEERVAVRMGILKEYIDFINKSEGIKRDGIKYGTGR